MYAYYVVCSFMCNCIIPPIGSKFDRQIDDEPLNFGGQLILDAVNYDFATGHWKIGKVQ